MLFREDAGHEVTEKEVESVLLRVYGLGEVPELDHEESGTEDELGETQLEEFTPISSLKSSFASTDST